MIGSSITIKWTQNHQEGTYELFLVPSSEESTLESLSPSGSSYLGSYSYSIGSSTITVPAGLEGSYVLQWRWDSWRNCMDLQIGTAKASTANKGSSSSDNSVSSAITSGSAGGKSFSVAMVVIGAIAVAVIVAVVAFLKFRSPEQFAQLKQDIIG